MVVMAATGAWWASGRARAAAPRVIQSAPAAVQATDPVDAPRQDTATVATPDVAAAGERPTTSGADTARSTAPPATSNAQHTPVNSPGRGATAAARPRPMPTRAAESRPTARQPAPSAETPAGSAQTTAAVVPPDAADTPTTPAQAPVSVAVATSNPREHCAGRHLVAMHRCLVRECEKPEYTAHRECQKVREIEARARAVLDNN
jgi:hypothetical protein